MGEGTLVSTEPMPVYLDDSLYSDSMMPNGWIVIVHVSGKDIAYGGFNSKEEALQHGSRLANARVQRLFFPTLH